MAQRLPLSTLRGIKLPPAKDGEPDHITSLRMTLQFHAESQPSRVICVPEEIAAMVSEKTEQSDQTDPTDLKPKGKK